MCYYTKVYFNSIPTIHKKYRKQNKQPKRKLVRQIILEINSLDMQTHRNFLFLVVPLLFIIIFSLANIFYWVVLNYETKSKRNERNETKRNETKRNITKRNEIY